jgi:hypothetical protein
LELIEEEDNEDMETYDNDDLVLSLSVDANNSLKSNQST